MTRAPVPDEELLIIMMIGIVVFSVSSMIYMFVI